MSPNGIIVTISKNLFKSNEQVTEAAGDKYVDESVVGW